MHSEFSKASKPLIVIVDDDTSVLRLLRSILRTSGFRVLMANSGDDALRLCTRFQRPIDAMITDVEMPGTSGFTLAEELAVTRPQMPVLFMSGSFAEREWEGNYTIPATSDFVAKPFTGDLLKAKLTALIAAARIA